MTEVIDRGLLATLALLAVVNCYAAGVSAAQASCTEDDCEEMEFWWNDGSGAPYGYAFTKTHAFKRVLSNNPLGGDVSEPAQPVDGVDRYSECDIDINCNLGGNQPDPIEWYEGDLINTDSCVFDDAYDRWYCGIGGVPRPGSWYGGSGGG